MEHLRIHSTEEVGSKAEDLVFDALQRAFPQLLVLRQVPITSWSGKRPRQTIVDLVLEDANNKRLYIEITVGSGNSHRKRRQRKTAGLAGIGQRRLTLNGDDIAQIQAAVENQDDQQLAETLRRIFSGRFNAGVFAL